MTFETFTATVALVGIVILVSSLFSGLVERTGFPQVAIFLLLGAALGPFGVGLFELALDSPALRTIATLALVLVLFSDAISLDLGEIRREVRLALLVLGPGSLIPAGLIALAAWYLLGLHWAAAAIVGASLASTDPVLLRTLLRRSDIPARARLALRLETGMNDVVLLPVVVFAMLFLHGAAGGAEEHRGPAELALELLVLGPGAGVVAGLVGITLLDRVRKSVGVRRDYESLYALGVAFTAFAAAEAAGGSGFLAAFAAGLTIASLDIELCDCFLEYGDATAEMFLLLTFVAFGGSLIWRGLDVISVRTVAFAAIALGVRTLVLLPLLPAAGLDRESRNIVAWFGARGLSTLLLVLLPVFARIAGAEELFALCCFVVLLSVLLHGSAIAVLIGRRGPLAVLPQSTGSSATPASPAQSLDVAVENGVALHPVAVDVPERIALAEVRALQDAGEPVVVLDVRTQRTFDSDPVAARGALRVRPDDAVRVATAHRVPWKATLVAFCA
jgi:NhaP-type Na+/H+ or K+/H+ antiporter